MKTHLAQSMRVRISHRGCEKLPLVAVFWVAICRARMTFRHSRATPDSFILTWDKLLERAKIKRAKKITNQKHEAKERES